MFYSTVPKEIFEPKEPKEIFEHKKKTEGNGRLEKITQCVTSKLVLFKSRRIKRTDQTARVRDKGKSLV